MSTKENLAAVDFIDLSEEELKEALGYLFSSIKRLQEESKTDPEVERLTDLLKNYKEDNFGSEIKRYTKLLKGARAVATAKGIKWRNPESTK